MTLFEVAVLIAALGSAIVGGSFFAFSTFIMRSLAALPPSHGMAAMVSINRVILRSLFMPVFLGTAVLGVVLTILAFLPWSPASLWLLLGAFFLRHWHLPGDLAGKRAVE